MPKGPSMLLTVAKLTDCHVITQINNDQLYVIYQGDTLFQIN